MAARHPSRTGGRRRSRVAPEGPDLFEKALERAVAGAFEATSGKGSVTEHAPAVEVETPASPVALPREPDAEPIPARMLNEFVYCPRLFYYEHVEGVFADNADTVRGRTVHKRVDAGKGAMPAPDEHAQLERIHSRSVSLGSERLGVTAKLDLVECAAENGGGGEALAVHPVDYKAGSPRQDDDGIAMWPTDRIQLGLQILLLRDNGYRCDSGIIYYRGTKQRVPLEWTEDLEHWILEQINAARRVASGPIPPPLDGSPKCARCSLNPVCLPDETLLMCGADGARHAVRRLIAPRDDSRALYLNTPGLHVGRKDDRLVVKDGKDTVDEVRINDLSQVSLFGNIQISTQAVQTLCEKEIPIAYFSMGGWFYGITRGHGLKNVFTRIEQFRVARDTSACLRLAQQFVHGKIRNHRTMLMRLHREPPAPIVVKLKVLAARALDALCIDELLGIEGAAAAHYFSEFGGLIKAGDEPDEPDHAGKAFTFDFAGRNRRPPSDPVNAMLSLSYSLLSKDCALAAAAVGFDPYIGFYHRPRFGRPALALDLMEEFRPLIAESAVLSCINNGMIRPGHFVSAGRAVNLTPEGRKAFFQCYEQRMNGLVTHPVFDYKASYRRVLELQFRILARFLTGEIPTYQPFLTR